MRWVSGFSFEVIWSAILVLMLPELAAERWVVVGGELCGTGRNVKPKGCCSWGGSSSLSVGACKTRAEAQVASIAKYE